MEQAGILLDAHVANLIRVDSNDDMSLGWNMTHQLFDKTNTVAKGIGARLVICLLPLWIQVSDEQLSQFVRSHSLDMRKISLEKPQQIMKEWARRSGIEIVDLLPGFRAGMETNQQDLFLPNDGHWNGAGHRLAALIVSEELISRNIVNLGALNQRVLQ